MNERKLIYDILTLYHKNKKLSYKKIVNIILSQYQNEFRQQDFYLNLKDISLSDSLLLYFKYNPFQFAFNNKLSIRQKLFQLTQEIITNNDNELISIGTGNIDNNGIMLIGMAPGFYTGDDDDKISQPFKPSFFFQNTSELLRIGFKNYLHKIYFTNASKLAVEKQLMNESYEENYEKYWFVLKQEIELLQPKMIFAVGSNVYDFLLKKNIICEKIYHPAYFIYRHQHKQGIDYYNNLIKE